MNKKLLLLIVPLIFIGVIASASPQKATVFNPLNGHRKVVNIGDPNAFRGGYVLEIARAEKYQDTMLGYSVVSAYRTTLSSPMTSTQTTVPVSSLVTKDGHTLTMTDLGSKVFLTLEAGSAKEEIVMCTTISGSAWATCTRGLAFYGTSVTAVAANQKTHSAGSVVTISNVHYVYEQYTNIEDAQTIAGLKTFTTIPQIPTSTPTLDAQVTSKKYVDATVSAGASDGTETTKGLWEGATRAEMLVGTATGGTSAGLLLQNRYATSTPSATTTIPITGSNGKLSQLFLDLTDNFTWTGNHSFATTSLMTNFGIPGQIVAYATSSVPIGWLTCNGASLSTSTYANLFSVIGYTFGGATSTFSLPDLRGRQITMASSSLSYATSTGAIGGEQTHTQTIAEMPSHNHAGSYTSNVGGSTTGIVGTTVGSGSNSTNVIAEGGGTAFNVLDPYMALNYIIKY